MTRLATLTLILALAAAPLAARPALRDVEPVREGLIAAAIAYEVGDRCESLSARLLRGIVFLNGLRSLARDLGYSNAEIDAFVDDRDEQRALEETARARLRSMGGVEGQWETYCAVGRAEIAADTAIGRLLR